MNQNSEQTSEDKKFTQISQILFEKKGLKTIIPKGQRGGFGYVLFVQDINTDIKYAVKAQSIIDEVNGGIDNDKNQMCKSESEILKSIKHKNVVEYHSDYTIGFFHFIQMSLCDCSLYDWIQKRGNASISTSLFLHFLNQILDGIEHLHSLNYVLRDLSARNILIATDGTIKLCDFGLTKKIQSQNMSSGIESNSVKGVFVYHPPELINELAKKSIVFQQSKRGDIWALGICLSLLGGLTLPEVAHFNQPQSMIIQAPLLDKDCNQIIKFILKKDPTERPSICQIRKYIFDLLSSNSQELQISQTNQQYQSQQEIDNFYNSREIDIEITKYKETEKECLQNLNQIESLIKLGNINIYYHYDFDKAYQYFIDALSINSNDPDVYLGLSQILLEKWKNEGKKSDQIEYYLEKAFQISPHYWRVYFLKSQKQYYDNQDKEALIYLKISMELKPNQQLLICFQYLLQSYLSKDKCERKSILNEFIDQNFGIKYRLYYRYLGQMAKNLEEYEKSNLYFEEELKYFPKNALILNNIGVNYERMKKYEKALQYFKEALQRNPMLGIAKENIIRVTEIIIKQQLRKSS